MAFTEYCNPCERKSIESKSESWCCECEEGLCDKCLQDHKAIKMTQYHHVVKITSQDLGDNYHLLSIPNCELHAELKEDLLCKDHDAFCCNGCLVTEHKACKNVVPLDVAAKGVKNSELFQAIKGGMVVNKKVSNKIIKERQASKEELNRQELRIRKEIANIKSRFMEHINNLEKSLLSELAEIPKENAAEIMKETQEIEKIEKGMEADEKALTFVVENGSESQIFSYLCKLNKKQFEIKEKLEEIPSTSRITITLEEASHNIEAINSLGFLSVRYDSVTKSEGKTEQIGMLNKQVGIYPHLKVEKEMEIDPKHYLKEEQAYDDSAFLVNDFAVTEENQLLVMGQLVTVKEGTKYTSNNQLVKYDMDMKFVKSYNISSINGFSYSCTNLLTCVPKSHQVVVSDTELLHFVNSKTMTKMFASARLTVPKIIDVTANTTHIFVLQYTGDVKNLQYIQVCDLIGRELKTINISNKLKYTSIIWQPNDNFLCKTDNNVLASLMPDGSNLFCYGQNSINVEAVDSNGSIYMAVEDGIDVMHPREQQVKKVFTCSPDTAKQINGLEINKDNSSFVVLYRKQEDTGSRVLGNYYSVNNLSYSLEVLGTLK